MKRNLVAINPDIKALNRRVAKLSPEKRGAISELGGMASLFYASKKRSVQILAVAPILRIRKIINGAGFPKISDDDIRGWFLVGEQIEANGREAKRWRRARRAATKTGKAKSTTTRAARRRA